MFSSVGSFNQDVNIWNTSQVTNMGSIFQFTCNANPILSACCVGAITLGCQLDVGDYGGQHDAASGGQLCAVQTVGHAHQRPGPAAECVPRIHGRPNGPNTTGPGILAGSCPGEAEEAAGRGQRHDREIESVGPMHALHSFEHDQV